MINKHKNRAICRVTNMECIILDTVYIIKKNARLANTQIKLFNRYLELCLGNSIVHLAMHSQTVKMPPIITVDSRRLSR